MPVSYQILQKWDQHIHDYIVVIIFFQLLLFCLLISTQNYLFFGQIDRINFPERWADNFGKQA